MIPNPLRRPKTATWNVLKVLCDCENLWNWLQWSVVESFIIRALVWFVPWFHHLLQSTIKSVYLKLITQATKDDTLAWLICCCLELICTSSSFNTFVWEGIRVIEVWSCRTVPCVRQSSVVPLQLSLAQWGVASTVLLISGIWTRPEWYWFTGSEGWIIPNY